MKKHLKTTLALLMLSSFAGCNAGLPLAGRAPIGFQSLKSKAKGRDPMPLIQQYHAPLIERNPELVKLKYQAMSESPFVFYRATAFLFYNDIKSEAALAAGARTTLQGDFHLENMGTYITSQGGFAFDLNDFDEAVSGPNSWELARMAVSVHLAADETGFGFSDRQQLISHFLQRYLVHLQNLQKQPALLQQPLDERALDEKAATQVTEARERFTRPGWLAEMTSGGRFRHDDKVRPISPAERQQVAAALSGYAGQRREGARFFTLKDAASRIAGKGSLGRYRYITLVEGPSAAANDDLILEIKEAIAPSANYAAVPRAHNEATRIVQAFQSSIPGADPLLGITRLSTPQGALPAYVRELLPKETVNLAKLNKTKEYMGFLDSTALICARMHARSGQLPALIKQTPALFPAIQEFADRYAEVVASDWKAFKNSR